LAIFTKKERRPADRLSVYDLLIDECSAEDCIIKTDYRNLSVIPSNSNLAGAEIELLEIDDKEYLLSNRLKEVKDKYDYIFIDCPPSLSVLTLNAMCAADSVIIPIQCEYYALEGLTQILNTIELVKERLNDKLEVEGVVFTMFDGRNNLSSDVVANVKENLDIRLFDTIIPRNVRLAEAPSYGMPVIYYDNRSTGATSYRYLAKEVVKRS
jgi:chromosome partitioning protein